MTIIEEFMQRKNKMTIIICAINVLVFIGLTMIGMTESATFMLNHGAMYAPYVVGNHEYYRIFTSMFLHFGIEHLGSNMLLLMVIGSILEEEMGRIKYVILYIITGICGNLLSLAWELKGMDYAVSGGASGAIFGVIGATLWVAIRNKGRLQTLTSQGLLFVIAFSLYIGFTSSGVDNLAHIGGLVSGFLLSIAMYRQVNNKGGSYSYC